jgi:hypothetical protein
MRRNHNSLSVILLAVVIALITGCDGLTSQPPPAATDIPNSQQLPFTAAKQLVIPADTVIYVRLKQPLRAADAEAGQDFPAVLDKPLLEENQVIAPQGSEIAGKVVAARQSGRLHTAGYVRIRLSSIAINGKQFPLTTNSVIAAGGSLKSRKFSFLAGDNSFRDSSSKEAGFTPVQRLAFRLTQPLNVPAN